MHSDKTQGLLSVPWGCKEEAKQITKTSFLFSGFLQLFAYLFNAQDEYINTYTYDSLNWFVFLKSSDCYV